MKFTMTKKLLVLSVEETKNNNPDFRTYKLVSTEDDSPDMLTIFGSNLPVERMKEYVFDIDINIYKKTLREAGENRQYDICKMFVQNVHRQ